MQNFFIETSPAEDGIIRLSGADVNHMKNVLRMKPGELVQIQDGQGITYTCRISGYEDREAVLEILETKAADTELPSALYLFQGLPKGDKMEWIVQKAVELGAAGIIPFAAGRSVVRLDEKKAEKKTARWQAIARSAAEQCGRAVIPEVSRPVSFAEALKQASELDVILIPYELERGMEETAEIIRNIRPGQSVGIFIGPEGGFDAEEVEKAKAAGARPVSLGSRILRTETAGIAALSILMYHLESQGHNVK